MTKVSLPISFNYRPLFFRLQRPVLFQSAAPMAATTTEAEGQSRYPSPISPPYPAVSKELELRRATAAQKRSAAFVLANEHVVYEDQWIVVVNKPSGIYCETLLSALSSSSLVGQEDHELELHLANRLDRDTSGLMVITKSHKVAGKLVKAFTEHKVKKTYLALCVAPSPDWKKIKISSGHGRSKFGAWRVYSVADVGGTLPGGSIVKDMVTSFELLSFDGQENKSSDTIASKGHHNETTCIVVEGKDDERIQTDNDEKSEVLVRAYPESGRTHQIRLHCQHLGIPIRGDAKYGGVLEWKGVVYDAHALHAESLFFEHPVTAAPLRLNAPVPEWASKVFGHLI